MKILPVEAEFFHLDGQTDRHDEVNSRFRNFAKAHKNVLSFLQFYYSFLPSQETAWFAAIVLPLCDFCW
jgi:hypothetical protein